MAMTIEQFVEGRGIKSLFHFTRLVNLHSIVAKGLLPKDACAKAGVAPVVNDQFRFDGTNAVCASISFPNYKMFYPLRCDNAGTDWVVLKLKRSLLWRTRCAFCVTNAANSAVSSVSLDKRTGLAALQEMFTNYEGKERSTLNIPDHYPTNPQAEVLLLDGTTPADIKGIYFQRSDTMKTFEAAYNGPPCHLNGGYFDGRSDYQHWK